MPNRGEIKIGLYWTVKTGTSEIMFAEIQALENDLYLIAWIDSFGEYKSHVCDLEAMERTIVKSELEYLGEI